MVSGIFRRYTNKSLMEMTSCMLTSSKGECTILCLRTNGCLAVSVSPSDDVMWCNLVTSRRDENDFVDDAGSDVYVLGESACFLSPTGYNFRSAREEVNFLRR